MHCQTPSVSLGPCLRLLAFQHPKREPAVRTQLLYIEVPELLLYNDTVASGGTVYCLAVTDNSPPYRSNLSSSQDPLLP